MRDTPEWRNWQTRLTQNQVLRSVGSSPTSGTNAKAAGKCEAFPPLFCIHPTFSGATLPANFYAHPHVGCSTSDASTIKTQETAAQP